MENKDLYSFISDGPHGLTVIGPNAVTVGVPCSYICFADCSPNCNYTMGIDDLTGEGNEVQFTLSQWVTSKKVTCTATNTATGKSATTRKTLRILGMTSMSITANCFLLPRFQTQIMLWCCALIIRSRGASKRHNQRATDSDPRWNSALSVQCDL